jgi:lipopolysaccharide transport system ATP-binding protein
MKNMAIDVQNLSKIYDLNLGKKITLKEHISSIFKKTKYSEKFYALMDINFKVEQGESIGIIGRNGAGKSTLLKVLSRITPPTKGKATIRGRMASLLEIGTGFHGELTGRENVYLNGSLFGMSKKEIDYKLDQIVAFSGVEKFINTQVKNYSSGMQVRLAFSVAAHLEPEILILDEVFAVGDSEFQRKCIEKMKSLKKDGITILLASHDLSIIQNNTIKSILLDNGKIVAFDKTEVVCNLYNESVLKHYSFINGIIKNAIVKYANKYISIIIDFENEKEWDSFPNLGLVIYNSLFQPVTGSNMIFENNYDHIPKSHKGKIHAELENIELSNGQYYISLWLADGLKEVQYLEYSLSFTVKDTTTVIKNTGSLRHKINFQVTKS